MSLSSSGFGHHQIVTMNDLVTPTVAEDAGNFTTLIAGDTADVAARIGRETAAGLAAGAGADDHRVAALKDALDRDNAGGQQALAAPQSAGGTVVDGERPRWVYRTGDPRLARRARFAARQK